ncbi:hypothetical protein C7M84_018940 [Penaeus vannamei]|uniref:Uncharacterized protein n=1 Tax=Penaeus vannamei TaxID=6689 RepID=A0A3R7LZH9_PENVA|nr:hypothetical protein C7M84_018940 [Penaeus vannamei]
MEAVARARDWRPSFEPDDWISVPSTQDGSRSSKRAVFRARDGAVLEPKTEADYRSPRLEAVFEPEIDSRLEPEIGGRLRARDLIRPRTQDGKPLRARDEAVFEPEIDFRSRTQVKPSSTPEMEAVYGSRLSSRDGGRLSSPRLIPSSNRDGSRLPSPNPRWRPSSSPRLIPSSNPRWKPSSSPRLIPSSNPRWKPSSSPRWRRLEPEMEDRLSSPRWRAVFRAQNSVSDPRWRPSRARDEAVLRARDGGRLRGRELMPSSNPRWSRLRARDLFRPSNPRWKAVFEARDGGRLRARDLFPVSKPERRPSSSPRLISVLEPKRSVFEPEMGPFQPEIDSVLEPKMEAVFEAENGGRLSSPRLIPSSNPRWKPSSSPFEPEIGCRGLFEPEIDSVLEPEMKPSSSPRLIPSPNPRWRPSSSPRFDSVLEPKMEKPSSKPEMEGRPRRDGGRLRARD